MTADGWTEATAIETAHRLCRTLRTMVVDTDPPLRLPPALASPR